MSNSLQPYGLQHTRLTCPSPTPRACSNACPLSRWCHPTTSPSVIPFSSHLQSFPASGSFQMSQFFASGSRSTGASASASVLPRNIQNWFALGLTVLIPLHSKELQIYFYNSTTKKQKYPQIIWLKKWTDNSNKHFSKEDIQMTNRYTKRSSTSLIIKEMLIKTAVRYHPTHVRVAVIKKTRECEGKYGEKGNFVYCWLECKLVQPLWKMVRRFFKKLGRTTVKVQVA